MPCSFSRNTIENTISFHGHSCPGLAIGIRVSELALRELGHHDQADLVAVVETDMCGVDAIQALTGCTLGKGNLIHRDYGKMAFSFFSRKQKKGFRAMLNPSLREDMDAELAPLMKRISDGTATEEDRKRAEQLRRQATSRFLDCDLETMFRVVPLESDPPKPPVILETLVCQTCGERTMESRTRRYGGKTLCIPCFQVVEQKM